MLQVNEIPHIAQIGSLRVVRVWELSVPLRIQYNRAEVVITELRSVGTRMPYGVARRGREWLKKFGAQAPDDGIHAGRCPHRDGALPVHSELHNVRTLCRDDDRITSFG